jgi:hypothetical protein
VTLYGAFFKDHHNRLHKWYQYFALYELYFACFRNHHVTIFEIGVGEGGSLQQWRDYFGPFSIIADIDIYPRCKQLEDSQIHVRIGSQDDRAFLAEVAQSNDVHPTQITAWKAQLVEGAASTWSLTSYRRLDDLR